MGLDRPSIERKDFPVGPRGYDPAAVDAHLSALAAEIDAYKRSSRQRSDRLASTASEQVRAIVHAAETSAAGIQQEAESDAREIRQEAQTEAQTTRANAADQAREYLGTVSTSTNSTLERLRSMQQELDALRDSLRDAAQRLAASLQLLEADIIGASAAVASDERRSEPEPPPGAQVTPEPARVVEPAGIAEPAGVVEPDRAFEAAGGEGGLEPAADSEGVRLIALNMALSGTPRVQTARYLSENFHLSDADGILDEVYASIEG